MSRGQAGNSLRRAPTYVLNTRDAEAVPDHSAVMANIAFFLSAFAIFASLYSVQPLLPIFAAAVVGGLGSPIGAIAGGFVIAFSEVMVTYAWKKVLGYLLPDSLAPEALVQLLTTDYKFAVSFSILIIVLLFMPTGLFKGK